MLLCPAGTFQLWGHSIQVDWAEPEKDVDEEVMQRVRVLYVRTHTHTNTHVCIFITFLFSLFVSSVVSTSLKVKVNLAKTVSRNHVE